MSEPNPYAPPSDDAAAPARRQKQKKSPRAWREGDCAVISKDDARLPKRCVVCNRRVEGDRIRRQFTWHPQWVYATFFIGFLVYLIVAAVTRKGATVELALCEQHQIRRRSGLILLFGGLAVGVTLLIAGSASDTPALLFFGLLLTVTLPIAGGIMARTAYPAKIDDRHVWLKVGQPFLESLPYAED